MLESFYNKQVTHNVLIAVKILMFGLGAVVSRTTLFTNKETAKYVTVSKRQHINIAFKLISSSRLVSVAVLNIPR